MTKKFFLIFLLLGISLVLKSPETFALQSGGVEIGDLETGSVVGQPFKTLDVDLALTALCIGGEKVWYPPTSILDLGNQGTGARAGRPILMKVTNNLKCTLDFSFSADSAFAGPTSLNVKIVLKPGETKYIGIPTSDLTYVTASNVIIYGGSTNTNGCLILGGQLLVIK